MYTIHMLRSTWKDGKYEQYWDVVDSFQYKEAAHIALRNLSKNWPSGDFQLTSADKPSK